MDVDAVVGSGVKHGCPVRPAPYTEVSVQTHALIQRECLRGEADGERERLVGRAVRWPGHDRGAFFRWAAAEGRGLVAGVVARQPGQGQAGGNLVRQQPEYR